MLTKAKNLFFRCQRFLKTYYLLNKHVITLQFRQTTSTDKVAIIYLMRKRVYFQMALICISSFLYYNRNFKIVVYCDIKLLNLCKILLVIFRKQSIEIRNEIDIDSDPMLEQVKMFARTRDGKTILMDADIRWTGPMVYNFSKPLVYNYEDNSGHIQAWNQIKNLLDLEESGEFKVYTCCVSSLGKNSSIYNAQELEHLLLKTVSIDWNSSSILSDRFHIRGQFLISHIISELGIEVDSIVKMETDLEINILETSFYGATGYRYGT